jgi:hypothetical protein
MKLLEKMIKMMGNKVPKIKSVGKGGKKLALPRN